MKFVTLAYQNDKKHLNLVENKAIPTPKVKSMNNLYFKSYTKFVLIGFLMIISFSKGFSQFTVSHAKQGIPGQHEGFFYALPQTVLKVDFILEKTISTQGPYSQYAERMLGVQDFVNSDATSFRILDVIVSPLTEPDPEAVFYVRFDERTSKEEQKIPFALQADGILLAAGNELLLHNSESSSIEKTLVNSPEKKNFKYYAERNLFQRIDTIIRKITIDTTVIKLPVLHPTWEDRSPEQKARAAADYIQTIREARFLLVSGYQEINYGNSLIYMDHQLKQLEEAYLSLFLGLQERILEEQTVYYTPTRSETGIVTIARLSKDLGIVNSSLKGEAIQLSVEPAGITQNIPGVGKESLESVTVINSLLYRSPEIAQIEVLYNGKSFANERLKLPQLGVISVAPFNKTRLNFDAKTGQVIKLIRE
jgi:hypothetical protein